MVKKVREKNKLLRHLSENQAFYFYTSIGNYCGVKAHSLEEFADALQYVCSDSILFHVSRGDFQNWIKEAVGDSELANRISMVTSCSRELSDECCRNEIFEELRIRILQLEIEKSQIRPACLGKPSKREIENFQRG